MFVLHNHSLRPNGDAVDNDVFEVGNEAYVPVITLGRFLWPPDHPMEVREKAQSDVPWTTAFPVNSGYLAAFAEPSIFYMGNVLLHLGLGLEIGRAHV